MASKKLWDCPIPPLNPHYLCALCPPFLDPLPHCVQTYYKESPCPEGQFLFGIRAADPGEISNRSVGRRGTTKSKCPVRHNIERWSNSNLARISLYVHSRPNAQAISRAVALNLCARA